MDTLRFVIAMFLWATVPPAFLYWYLIHPFAGYWKTQGPARTLMIVAPLCLLALGFMVRYSGVVAGTDLGTNYLFFYTGLTLWGVSIALDRKIRKHLDFGTLVGLHELRGAEGEEEQQLLDEGPYAMARHPRYGAGLVGTAGFAFMANYGAAWFMAALSAVLLAGLIRMEETELEARFGDRYRAYREQVPALIPRLRGALEGAG